MSLPRWQDPRPARPAAAQVAVDTDCAPGNITMPRRRRCDLPGLGRRRQPRHEHRLGGRAAVRTQTDTGTAGHLRLQHGTRTGDRTNIYRCLVGMMNTSLQRHGRLEVHAILPDRPKTTTICTGCLPRG